ncbi:hypothetical protein SLV14_003634 [Streptomyces sp. Je 1-4]|uniref:hypothetical protein n=1 Tax=Streptomyces TaxID=1883 RepID=UPI0021D91B7C|nr:MULTISPECIES: hypothetical protein [unclassified Streptomyces]UYB40954.1 hypothetical protein SLV14_003634 [Streptomyces sp. Je 1-4]UZQ37115.1 hypothetical protein SLV14N_003634 [Streptomyces sp. Je 1-4] [Streptomyces sp. Je 1-4 4N24]UZQ44532.1 hypothetical protein SLV14NA_003634 [Streptomyces sp. Je 1-4] [Streptomyces sp. Je 1-4 4N24_ara]
MGGSRRANISRPDEGRVSYKHCREFSYGWLTVALDGDGPQQVPGPFVGESGGVGRWQGA